MRAAGDTAGNVPSNEVPPGGMPSPRSTKGWTGPASRPAETPCDASGIHRAPDPAALRDEGTRRRRTRHGDVHGSWNRALDPDPRPGDASVMPGC